jgi:hypothetical protein
MVLDDHAHLDLDDMFGVRHAIEGLPAALQLSFLDEWCTLTETRMDDLAAIHAVVTRAAKDRTRQAGDEDPIAVAWRLVSEAMTRYRAWVIDR